MPGKVASSTPRAPRRAAASKASGRNTTSSVDIPDEGESTSLRHQICYIFADSQRSTASHRKNVLKLRKLQESCCYVVETPKKKERTEDFSEEQFDQEFMRCLLRVLPVKKTESVADRVIRFVGTFLATAIEKDNEIWEQSGDDAGRETPTARLASLIFTTLLPMLQAKDKTIRFRSTQIISHLINSMDELDPGLFNPLRLALVRRIHDKEAPVRLQAVYGLGRLAMEANDEEEDDDSESDEDIAMSLLQKLQDVLANDPSAEVRRNVLLNLPADSRDMRKHLLARGRDVDTVTRRALFTRVVPGIGDFRRMRMAERKLVLRNGLTDREESVRKAAAKMFSEHWIETCVALPADKAAESEIDPAQQQTGQPNKAATPSMDALMELLERIDVVDTGLEDGIASAAMREFWAARPDYVEFVSFPGEYWEDITPEMAFLVRSFNDYCRSPHNDGGPINQRTLDSMAEEKMPEVTKFGFLLERELKRLIESIISAATEPSDENNDECNSREFIVQQMLYIALTFDYSDEMGRRKMLGLMRETLALPDLPEDITRLAVDVLRLLCGESATAERDFCGMVIDDIYGIQHILEPDNADETESSVVDESFHSATSHPDDDKNNIAVAAQRKKKAASPELDPEEEEEREFQKLQIELKCLHITLYMLQNVQRDMHGNQQLEDYVNTRVLNAVRSRALPIKELGLQCLALTCLLGKTFANDYFDVFSGTYAKAKEEPGLQVICLHSIIDILTVYPSLCTPDVDLEASDAHVNDRIVLLLKILSNSLKSEDDTVQATGAIAIAKAMLHGLINNEDLLKRLVTSYFEPDNLGRLHFQQALSYFLPVYCHSRAENAERMARVTVGIISKMITLREDFLDNIDIDTETAGDGLLKLNTISQMLIDWTDPRKTVGYSPATADAASRLQSVQTTPRAAGDSSHFILAEGILERLHTSPLVKEEKKTLISMLGKLHLPAGDCGAETLQGVLQLVTEAIDARVAGDEPGKKTLEKLRAAMLALIRDVMTAERGGGGAEETVLDSTEVGEDTLRPAVGSRSEVVKGVSKAGAEEGDEDGEEEGEDEDEDEEDADQQLQREMRESTLGSALDATTVGFGFTTGLPDAEGTRIQDLFDDGTTVENTDTDMMDVDG